MNRLAALECLLTEAQCRESRLSTLPRDIIQFCLRPYFAGSIGSIQGRRMLQREIISPKINQRWILPWVGFTGLSLYCWWNTPKVAGHWWHLCFALFSGYMLRRNLKYLGAKGDRNQDKTLYVNDLGQLEIHSAGKRRTKVYSPTGQLVEIRTSVGPHYPRLSVKVTYPLVELINAQQELVHSFTDLTLQEISGACVDNQGRIYLLDGPQFLVRVYDWEVDSQRDIQLRGIPYESPDRQVHRLVVDADGSLIVFCRQKVETIYIIFVFIFDSTGMYVRNGRANWFQDQLLINSQGQLLTWNQQLSTVSTLN